MADTKDPPPWLRAGRLYPFPVTEHVRPDHLQPDDLGKSRHGGSALKILTVLWRTSDDGHLTVVMVTASREVFPVRAGRSTTRSSAVGAGAVPERLPANQPCRLQAPSLRLVLRSTVSFDEVPITPAPLRHQPPVLDRSAGDAGRSPASSPRLGEYIDRVRTKAPPKTLRCYDSAWRAISQVWGDRVLSEPTTREIEELMDAHQIRSRARANSRGGESAAENLLSALRHIYKHAVRDRLIDPSSDPAAAARLPGRRAGKGDVLTSEQLREVHRVASSTGNDPELDELIVMLHIQTASDRQAVIDLALHDLDRDNCLVRLRTRGGAFHWHPVSPRLMAALGRHVERRGGVNATHRVLRERNGRPISYRRYDGLWKRVRENLPWAQELEVTTYSITETVRVHVRQLFGETVERVYIGQHHDDTAVLTHLRGDVIEALMTITGEPHPLARSKRSQGSPGR
ncbi:tyrosine recombinase XerC [Nocardia beijingensis]|uniref:Tyrosine recombinase XerC n=1 Tax=Nocardia beijingensis TaxID=95162 RepID=A0ABW7W798_9NOCA